MDDLKNKAQFFFIFFILSPPCLLAATMTSAESSKKFHNNIPDPLHFTCWMNILKGSKNSEVGSYHLLLMVDGHIYRLQAQ